MLCIHGLYSSYIQETNGEDVKMEEEQNIQPMDVEYVPEQLDMKGSVLEEFSDVFARFQLPPESSLVCFTR